jgi:hypothetical protein
MAALRRFAAVIAIALMLGLHLAHAQSPATSSLHLGVATCAGGNCHGASERPAGSSVPGNEYMIWSKRDKHRQAYTVLLEQRAIRMARAVGLPDAANQKLCLDCHADNVPPGQRGRQFQLADGVGCEVCHGGASNWLGVHISGANHQQNIAAGLYPIEQPAARAEKCLGCHFGDATRFVDHRLLGAGHPRLGFELDTYSATQPAHFLVDAGYIQRKGEISNLQVWATGQAVAVVKAMDAWLDARRSRGGLFPEFALYDCQSCHHPYDPLQAPRPGGAPGSVKPDAAHGVMLQTVASLVAPAAGRVLKEHFPALRRAATEDRGALQREAGVLREAARALVPVLSQHRFSEAERRALAEAIIALGEEPESWRMSRAEQVTMALEAIIAATRSSEGLDPKHTEAAKAAMTKLHESFPVSGVVRFEAFATALRDVRRAIGR